MDLKNLNSFIEVAELGSFTRAAEKLGYSQPTISFQIHQLEEELNIQLFDRINHTIALTSQGQEVLTYAYQICRQVRELEAHVQQNHQIRGMVRVAMADSMCSWLMDGHFSALRREYPGVSLQITTASTEEMLHLLDQNQVDLAYTLDRHVYHRDYTIDSEEQIGTHFVVAASNPITARGPLTLGEVTALPCILTEPGMSYRKLLEQHLAQHSLEIDPILEIGNTDLICRLVEQGIGIAFLPDYVTEKSVAEGKLSYLTVEDFNIEIWKQLLHHRRKVLTPPIRTVMSFFMDPKSTSDKS